MRESPLYIIAVGFFVFFFFISTLFSVFKKITYWFSGGKRKVFVHYKEFNAEKYKDIQILPPWNKYY